MKNPFIKTRKATEEETQKLVDEYRHLYEGLELIVDDLLSRDSEEPKVENKN